MDHWDASTPQAQPRTVHGTQPNLRAKSAKSAGQLLLSASSDGGAPTVAVGSHAYVLVLVHVHVPCACVYVCVCMCARACACAFASTSLPLYFLHPLPLYSLHPLPLYFLHPLPDYSPSASPLLYYLYFFTTSTSLLSPLLYSLHLFTLSTCLLPSALCRTSLAPDIYIRTCIHTYRHLIDSSVSLAGSLGWRLALTGTRGC